MQQKFVNKPNSGGIIPIAVKKNPKAPDYKGSIRIRLSDFDVVDGDFIDIDLAGWKGTTSTGKPRLSLTAQKPWEGNSGGSGGSQGYSRSTATAQADPDEEIPF